MKLLRYLPREEAKRPLYIDGRLFELLKGFKNAVERHDTSVVLIIDGRSGMGKTTLSNQIGIALDKNYNLNKIHYSPKTFLEGGEGKIGLANAKQGDFILFDEAMLISNRSVLSQINRMIILAMSMIRSKRIYVCFCVNSLFDLDRNLAISRADSLFHVYGQSLIARGRFTTFFRGKDGIDRLKQLYLLGKKYYNYNQPRANFLGRFTKEFVIDEIEYERQKQIGINSFLKGTEGKLGKMSYKALEGRNKIIRHLYDIERWKVPKIVEVSGLDRSQIFKIVSKEGDVS
jgi:hypothetical protein